MKRLTKLLVLSIIFCLLAGAERAIAQEPSKEEQAAISLYQSGKTDEAIVAFSNILKTAPRNANAAGALSQLYMRKGDNTAAYKTAIDAMKLSPDAPDLAINAAAAALKLAKPDDALRLMDATIIKDPKLDYAHYIRGKALDAKGQLQQAIGAYSKSIALKADFPDVYYNRGADFYAISRYSDALKDFNKLLELDATWSIGYNKRGMANYALGNADAAIEDYTKTIELQPESAIPYANRGLIYLERKLLSAAKADFLKAVSLEPNYAEGHYGLARVYNEERAFAQALPEVEKAISLSTQMPAYLATHCATLIGLDRDREAIPVAEKIITLNERNTDGWIYKASAQSNIKDYSAAIATMNTAVTKLPDNYLLYALRAGIYRQQGNTAAAEADDVKAKSPGTR